MKQLFTLLFAVVLFAANASAQCTPNAPTGSPGLTPATDSLDCVEIGRPYSEVIYLENFGSFTVSGFTGTVDSLRIDSITNIPCGLTYELNKPSRTYYTAETGCLALTGTSYENVGQYRLNIYITVWATLPFVGQQVFNGEAAAVVGQVEQITGPLGIDFNYFLRVTEANDPCPNIDRSTPGINLTATPSCAPPVFTATITGDTEVCAGETTTLTVTFTNGTAPYDILWTGGSTSTTITVGVGTHTITAIDSNTDTATATVTVSELPLPTADFTYTVTGGTVAVTSTSTGSPTTATWDFDGMAHTGSTASHTFTANGDYDITLIVANDCGNDTITETVTIAGVGINNLGNTLANVQVMPNPSNGTFTLNVVAKETSPVTVRIFNLQGQQVYTNTLNLVAGQASNQAISLSNAATGIYIIQVQANDALVTEKLIIK